MSTQDNKHKIKVLTEELALEQENLAIVNLIYPVGVVVFFAENVDPNELFHGKTTWGYIGENKTIRLANSNGSNILATGGQDLITLKTEQLPPHKHSFLATTDSFDYGIKSTSTAGEHKHATVLAYDQTQEPVWGGYVLKGVSIGGYEYSHNAKVAYTDTQGNHTHSVNIGGHHHTVSGTTASTGNGEIIDITNDYIMLMGWYRIE
ncbi:phage baseplate protein [Xenorhabdus stockiae]|uniref:phage baseplate protein n=1 Tax=Xenorhabdus stockiae TaxID=351614 RepID=UPI0040637593